MNVTPNAQPTFADLWRRAVERHRDRTFLTFRSEHGEIDSWTYRQFDVIVRDAVWLLTSSGVVAGEPVHLCLRNCPAFIAVWLATAELGAWMVPVDPASSSRDIERQLARVSPKIGFHASAPRPTWRPWRRAPRCAPSPWRRRPQTSDRVDDCAPTTSRPDHRSARRTSSRLPGSP
jgi:acyl-coenzyme A synthetase/AMP-(fatty) acid ligase